MTGDGPWMITAFDIGDGEINFESARHTSQYAFDTQLSPKSKPRLHDILVTKDGTLGRVAFVDRSGVCINQSVAVLRPRPDTDMQFVMQCLRSPQGQRLMLRDAGGSTIKHIYITKLAEVIIPYPAALERECITQILTASESLRTTTEVSKTKRSLLFIEQRLQYLRSQPSRFRFITDFLHHVLKRLPVPAHFTQPDAEESLQFSAVFLRQGSKGLCGFRVDSDVDHFRLHIHIFQ
jgi:hypothetical protein